MEVEADDEVNDADAGQRFEADVKSAVVRLEDPLLVGDVKELPDADQKGEDVQRGKLKDEV